MTNFAKKLEDASEDELKSWVNELDFCVVPLASDELTRRSLKKLQKAIEQNTEQMTDFVETTNRFNNDTSSQTKKMIKLTWGIFVLTIVMIFGLLVQIYYIKKQIYLARIQVEPILWEQKENRRKMCNTCQFNPESTRLFISGEYVECGEIIKLLNCKYN